MRTVRVLCAGPTGMVQATKLMVAGINSSRERGAPSLHFHQETWEL